MNILHIVNFFNGGGSTRACYEIARKQPDNNHYFVGSDQGIAIPWFNEIGEVFLLTKDHNFNYLEQNLSGIIRSRKIDLIHMYVPGHENVKCLKNFNLPKVVTVLCDQKIGFDVNDFDRVIFPSEYGKSLNSDKINESNSVVVRYGIGDKEDSFDKKTNNNEVVFGRISAICPSKKILDTLICAKSAPNNRFIVAGHVLDSNYDSFIRYFIHYNKMNNVDYRINISEDEKEQIYSEIDVLHYPTGNENFCISILEAMQRSKDVIAYKNSAIPEFDADFTMVEDDNISELIWNTQSIIEFEKHTSDSSKNNRLKYEQFYTAERYSKDIQDIYEELLK